ncbi:unnamed protein product, partial [Ixodes pacificus]
CHRSKSPCQFHQTTMFPMTKAGIVARSFVRYNILFEWNRLLRQSGRRQTSSFTASYRRINDLLRSRKHPWQPPPDKPWLTASHQEGFRPSPFPSSNHHPSPPLGDSDYSLELTPSQPSPPGPPTPGRWDRSSSFSPPRLPRRPQQLPSSPGSLPLTLLPPTPGAFLRDQTLPLTRTPCTTPKSPEDVSSLSLIHLLSETSRRLLSTCSKCQGIRRILDAERLRSSNFWSALCNCGTVGASGSPPATNFGSSIVSEVCTTSLSPGGEPHFRAPLIRQLPSFSDCRSPSGGQQLPERQPPTSPPAP